MSNYRRLISYIYAYEGGVKGKNIGYAKIEVRSGQCRIYVSVKKVYVGRNDIGVYLLTPGKELMLGRIFIRGGSGEFRITMAADNLDGAGAGIEQCYGLSVHDVESTWQCYTTIWEDAVAQAAEVELAEVTAENVRKQQAEAPKAQESAAEPVEQKEIRLPISEEIERELEREELQLQDVAPWENVVSENMMPENAVSEGAVPEAAMSENAEPEKSMPESEVPEVLEAEETAAQAERESFPELEDPERLAELERQELEKTRPNQYWERMQRRYARVLAFDYDKGCEILSIKPQDIGLLPREVWVYGNNSFLLHGYYNHRHLILARLNNPQGEPRYLLGVPGHYFSNEKYMAAMFGFPHFVIAKRQPDEDGRFGYWYTDIRL